MSLTKVLLGTLLSLIILSFTSDKPAYILYSKDGKIVAYKELLKKAQKADVVFFGEFHNNSISHWLQYELTKDLILAKDQKVILGAEMFEADNQLIIDEYLAGTFSGRKFETECKLWPNYKTDYKPLMLLADSNDIPFIATNIPRRYATVVYKKGFEGLDSLSDEAKRYIAPLPIEYDSEQDAYKSMMEHAEGEKIPAHINENLPKAQAVKDATMAYFIKNNLKKGHTFIHYNGVYHSDKYQGIIYYLNKYQLDLKIVTISTISLEDITNLTDEEKEKADFIIAVDEDMTLTY